METKAFDSKRTELEGALEKLGETIKVKGSLLKLESEAAKENLEKGIQKTKARMQKEFSVAKANVESAQVQEHLAVMEAKEEWGELKNYLENAINQPGVATKFDEIKLHAHLVEMDAKDRFSVLRTEWEDSYQEKILPGLSNAMDKMCNEISTFTASLKNK